MLSRADQLQAMSATELLLYKNSPNLREKLFLANKSHKKLKIVDNDLIYFQGLQSKPS